MKADRPSDPVDAALAGLRRATEAIEPPPDFGARVLAGVARPRPAAWWVPLGGIGGRAVPLAALAAAAALALAWTAEARLDDTAATAFDLAQELP